MTENCCPECGHLLSKRRLECSYCGWSRYDSQIPEALFDPENTQEYSEIYYKDYDDIERLIDKFDHDIFET